MLPTRSALFLPTLLFVAGAAAGCGRQASEAPAAAVDAKAPLRLASSGPAPMGERPVEAPMRPATAEPDLPADAPQLRLRRGAATVSVWVDERWLYGPGATPGGFDALEVGAGLRAWRAQDAAAGRAALSDLAAQPGRPSAYFAVRGAPTGAAPLLFHTGRALLTLAPGLEVEDLARAHGLSVLRRLPLGPNAWLVGLPGTGSAPLELAARLQGSEGVLALEVDWLVGDVRPQ